LLSGDPLAYVLGAILQSDAGSFTTGEEAHGLAVDKPYFPQVEGDHTVSNILVYQPLKLGKMLAFEATAKHEPDVVGAG
jgi:hypothetical protein